MSIDKDIADRLVISTDPELLDLELILKYLKEESYWAKDRTESAVRTSIENSLCFGVYLNGRQIGFARVVTDFAVVYYLADVFILPEFQNDGIGRKFMEAILEYGDLKNIRGILTTQTAHSFYESLGFSRDSDVVKGRMMVRDKK